MRVVLLPLHIVVLAGARLPADRSAWHLEHGKQPKWYRSYLVVVRRECLCVCVSVLWR
jgi:hypothetical protein